MISIVTPSFRQLDWLRLALASVADQQGVDIEHIVQDGGTEGVREMFEAITQPSVIMDYHAHLFVEKDAGMYDAVNRGLNKARGEICAYLNCDEQYLPGALAKVMRFFAKHAAIDVVFGDVILVNEQGQPLSYRRTVLPSLKHIRLAHLNTATCATFFRRKLLDRGFYFDTRLKAIGDGVWMERLLREKVPMATISEPLAVFTFTGQNLGATSLSKSESLERKEAALAINPFRWIAAVFCHRFRKALAGAYKWRRVEIDIFTLASPDRRQRRVGTNVGFGWPL